MAEMWPSMAERVTTPDHDAADLLETLDSARTEIVIQAGALEEFGARLLDDAGDLEAVLIDAIVANLRKVARELGAAYREQRQGTAKE